MLRFDNVCFSYGKKQILNDFNLEIFEGEKVAFLGLSGCGKTTLLHLASGLYKPKNGNITMFSGKASFIFQENRLFPWYTALENLTAIGAEHEHALIYLEKLGLSDIKDKFPDELSGGMQRRLSIARALALGGEIFFFDEPMQGLDAKTYGEVLELIREETRSKTLFLITHSETEADFLCERKIFLGKNPLGIISDIKK